MNTTASYDVTGYNVSEVVEVNIKRIGGKYVGRFEDWPNIALLVPKRHYLDKIIPALIQALYLQAGERVHVRHYLAGCKQSHAAL